MFWNTKTTPTTPNAANAANAASDQPRVSFADLPWTTATPPELEALLLSAEPMRWTWHDPVHLDWMLRQGWSAAEHLFVYAYPDHNDAATPLETWGKEQWHDLEALAFAHQVQPVISPDDADGAAVAHRIHAAGFRQRMCALLTSGRLESLLDSTEWIEERVSHLRAATPEPYGA